MKKLIPFRFLPASWGLKGTSREIAQAEYELEGYELAVKLNDLKQQDPKEKNVQKLLIDLHHNMISKIDCDLALANIKFTGTELDIEINKINYKHGLITEYDYETNLVKFEIADPIQRMVKWTELDYKYNKITEKQYDYKIADLRDDIFTTLKVQLKHGDLTQIEYDKNVATHKDEPWVHIPEVTFDKENPSMGSFNLDWNKQFIELLEGHGYAAPSEEQTVDLWLTDLCKNIALEELAGTGVFDEQAEEAIQLKRKKLSDGKTEIS